MVGLDIQCCLTSGHDDDLLHDDHYDPYDDHDDRTEVSCWLAECQLPMPDTWPKHFPFHSSIFQHHGLDILRSEL